MQTKTQMLNGIQNTEAKQNVRNEIMAQIVKYAKQCHVPVKLLSLPSTGWIFEKGSNKVDGLIDVCKKNGIKLQMTGIENSSEAAVQRAFENNAPKGAKVRKGDFDYWAESIFEDGFAMSGSNVLWADYCGNPAEIGYSSNPLKTRYSYPHIRLFKDIVANADKPMLYFMTFSCNGRIKGGADKMMKALCPCSSNIHSAIRHKILQNLFTYKLSHKAEMIMDIYYHGAGKHFMVTFGFAINFKPGFTACKTDWVGKDRHVKAVSKAKAVTKAKISWDDIKKEAMKILSDAGWGSEKIAHALNTQKSRVGPVLAWHKHRNSWRKAA